MLQAVTTVKSYEISLQTDNQMQPYRKFTHRKHTYKVTQCTTLVSSRYQSVLQKFRAEAIYSAFVFPRELRWLHYNCRPCHNNDTFCKLLALHTMKFAMWHVKRTAVIWNLLKMPSFRDRNTKIVQCLRHHTVY